MIFGITNWQMNLVMFWCSGVATLELYLAISRFLLIDYLVVILLTSCVSIQNIHMLSLVKILQLRSWSLWCIIMQLMGNILWLIVEGFGSCLGEHPLLFGDFKLVKQEEFFADYHRNF